MRKNGAVVRYRDVNQNGVFDGDELVGAAEDEVEDVADRRVQVIARDHGHVVAVRALDDEVLDRADLG